jgi:ketopantoate reductase
MMIGMVRETPTSMTVSGYASPIKCGGLLGDDPAPLHRLLKVAKSGFVPMEHDPVMHETIAFKLLFNSCMNPTGALTGLTYGELLENPATRALITGLANETLSAFDAVLDYRPAASGQHYVETILDKLVFPAASAHHSSMLQDV